MTPPQPTSAAAATHRSSLFKLVCISLFSTSAVGFVQPHSPQHYNLGSPPKSHLDHRPPSPDRGGIKLSSSVQHHRHQETECSTSLRLSHEEETELLRQAVEYRRITKLEQELALSPKYRSGTNPLLLSVKARTAGYGDELDLYEEAQYNGQKAREMLVIHNMGLVHYCVNQIIGKDSMNPPSRSRNKRSNAAATNSKYKKLPLNSLSREDLVQEGAIGLARAVDKWNPAIAANGKGNKFSTYAVYWIRAAVLRCIAERDDMMRVPSHVSQAVRKINKAASRLGLELEGTSGNVASSSLSWRQAHAAKKLAEEAGLTEQKFDEAMAVRSRRYSGGYVPFETWMQKGQSLQSDVYSFATATTAMADGLDAAATMMASENTEQVRSVLSKFLRPKEMEALSWRYGLIKDDLQVAGESPADRANRQFAEMEDQLFSNTLAATAATPAVTAAVGASATATMTTALPKPKTTQIPGAATGKSGEAMSFVDVGKRMQVSAEYTRKLCHKALDKLRAAAEEGRLEPALLF